MRSPIRSTTLTLGLLLVVAVPAAADDYAEFRIPAHRTFDWTAQLSGEASRLAASTGFSGVSSSTDRGGFGQLATDARWLWDSDPVRTAVEGYVQASGTRRSVRRENSGFVPGPALDLLESRQRRADERWYVAVDHRLYPWTVPVGLGVGVQATGQYAQAWDRLARRFDYDPGTPVQSRSVESSESWRYGYAVAGALTAGWGRVRDATPVFEAAVLEERLAASGVLARPLSTAARQKVAALFTVREEYAALRERAARDLWAELTRILAEDGALAEKGMSPEAVMRAAEPLFPVKGSVSRLGVPASNVVRTVGWLVGGRARGEHYSQRDRMDGWFSGQDIVGGVPSPPFEYEYHAATSASSDRAFVGLQAEYHRAWGHPWQLDAAHEWLFPVRRQEDGMRLDTHAGLTWIVADRWLATATARHARTIAQSSDGATAEDGWLVTADLGLWYFLEDRLTLSLRAQENQSETRWGAGPSGVVRNFNRSGRVLLSLDYRFAGRFHAPGIGLPASITPDLPR